MRIDYIKHIIAGFLIGFLMSILILLFGDYDWIFLSIIPTILAGIGKEYIWDKWLGRGTWEWQDIYCTFYGGLLAIIIAYICFYSIS